ncbi:MAG: hypothetical protein ABF904_11680 [Ethanoligenens sp.]
MLNEAIRAIEKQQEKLDQYSPAWCVGEQLKDILRETPAAAELVIQDIEQEKAAAIARAQELEKKLAIASNKETVLFAHLFEEMQGNFNQALGCVEKISENDVETAEKLRGALKKCLEMMEGKVNGKT